MTYSSSKKLSKRSDTHLLIVQNDVYYQLYILMNQYESQISNPSIGGIFWLFIRRPPLLDALLAVVIGCGSCAVHVSDGTMMQALISAKWSINFLIGAFIGFAFGILDLFQQVEGWETNAMKE